MGRKTKYERAGNKLADELEKCGVVSEFLLDRAPAWLED